MHPNAIIFFIIKHFHMHYNRGSQGHLKIGLMPLIFYLMNLKILSYQKHFYTKNVHVVQTQLMQPTSCEHLQIAK
jgi:hypothetical protein